MGKNTTRGQNHSLRRFEVKYSPYLKTISSSFSNKVVGTLASCKLFFPTRADKTKIIATGKVFFDELNVSIVQKKRLFEVQL